MKIDYMFAIPIPRLKVDRGKEYCLCKGTLLGFYCLFAVKEDMRMFGSEI